MSEKKDTVDVPSVIYEEMRDAGSWDLISDLRGGTRVMRQASTKWLPKEVHEEDEHYRARLARSFLLGAFDDTIDKLCSKPFSKLVTVQGLPEAVEYLVQDMDKAGTSVTQLAHGVLEDLCERGKTHLLVDYSHVPEVDEDNRPSIAAEKRQGARATVVRIAPQDLIGWRSEPSETGGERLTQLRIAQTRVESAGTYADKRVNYVKVINIDSWELWKEVQTNDGNEYQKQSEGKMTLGEIPLVTIYAKRTGFMIAMPPLLKLAFMNLAHWQSDSAQRNILRVSRFAILFGKGLTKEEAEKGLRIGPFQAYLSSSDTAELKYVEHTGKAIEAGRKDLEDLENRMETMGHQPLVKKQQSTTATGKAIDEGRNLSLLQSWIIATEIGIKEAFILAGRWHRINPSEFEDTLVDIFSDFKLTLRSSEDLQFLLKCVVGDKLSLETFLKEVARRGIFSEDFEADEEVSELLLEAEVKGMDELIPDDEEETEDED